MHRQSFQPALVVVVSWGAPMLLLLFVAMGSSQVRYGNAMAWVSKLQGQELLFDSRTKVINNAVLGQQASVGFSVTNISGDAVSLIGVRTGCGCVSANLIFPMILQPAETSTVSFNFSEKERPGDARREIVDILVYTSGRESEVLLKVVVES